VSRSQSLLFAGVVSALVGTLLAPAGCSSKETPQTTYFERTIAPVLTTSCVRTNTGAGCHVADEKGNALGNLDTASFEGVNRRRDLLLDYGPYGQPAFLVKNVDPFQIEVQSFDGKKALITTDIKHAGGSILDPTGSAYQTLRRWINNGASENNSGKAPDAIPRLPCNSTFPARADFDLSKDPAAADFGTFRDRVNPALQKSSCTAGNCHGTVANSLYLTCGDTAEQVRWNYLAASEYLGATPEQSELLRRPLDPAQGGAFHEGGAIWPSQSDPGYVSISEWAAEHGPAADPKLGDGFNFFAHRVQPILVKKGCMMVQCHSASMFHDYRLRGGAGGSFSLSATRRNYELSLQQLALESDDPNASRMIRKNLYRPEVCGVNGCNKAAGIVHRGGPLLEDFKSEAASAERCDTASPAYDYDNGDLDKIPPYCVLREWHKREQAIFKPAPLSAIAYVKRPIGAGLGRAQDFDLYAPGAELHIAKATYVDGALTLTAGGDASVNTTCGLSAATADIRRPNVSFDGSTIAFAARTSASEPFAVYEVRNDGTSCVKHAEINAGKTSENGLLVHNFDPAYSPPDENGIVRIVFASTRGNLSSTNYDYTGPQRTPSDPSKANSNLYVLEPDPALPGKNRIRQLTYLLNVEREPTFMRDGRVIFTAEKRAPGFYQLALRRINLDGGDYHPLYAQRGSIGYLEATSPIELAQKNFAAIFADPGAPYGGGTLAVFNRSIGIDFTSSKAEDYVIDSTILDPASIQSPDPKFFLHSLHFPDPSSSGRPNTKTSGLYTSPSPLPNGSLLVSFGEASDVSAFGGDYDLYVMNAETGAKTKLLGEPGVAEVEAVGIYGRSSHGVFRSTLDEPNGHTQIVDARADAEITILDTPVLASLLFQNTPTGRVLETDIKSIDLYEDLPPTLDIASLGAGGANVASDDYGRVYVRRRLIGNLPLAEDGSTKVRIPGGVPIVLKLPETEESRNGALPRFQRESIVYAPGEMAHQSFKAEFFNNLCGNCHGAISGKSIDVAVRPDVLTQASDVLGRTIDPIDLNKPPAARGPIEGPPATP